VFILADNVGYGDLGPYGGGELRGAPTPNIDHLAREGLRLTQYLVEPGCTPSRVALMTGQYSIRNGLSLIIVPGSSSTLPQSAVTMGELFKCAGYATAIRRSPPRPDSRHVEGTRRRRKRSCRLRL
jgi:arylsulfatase A-like enzyme